MPWMTLITFIFFIVFAISSARNSSQADRRLAFAFFAATIGTGFINFVALTTIVSAQA